MFLKVWQLKTRSSSFNITTKFQELYHTVYISVSRKWKQAGITFLPIWVNLPLKHLDMFHFLEDRCNRSFAGWLLVSSFTNFDFDTSAPTNKHKLEPKNHKFSELRQWLLSDLYPLERVTDPPCFPSASSAECGARPPRWVSAALW